MWSAFDTACTHKVRNKGVDAGRDVEAVGRVRIAEREEELRASPCELGGDSGDSR